MAQTLFEKIKSYPSFEPPYWCKGGHLQTLLGHFLPRQELSENFELIKIPTQDQDQLIAYFQRGTTNKLIILFHGLAGSTNSGYMTRLGNCFFEQGHSVLLVNHRGAHPEFPYSSGIYHSGRSEDMSSVFGWAKEKFPDLISIAMGFSMSANILLLNLAGVRSEHQPDFAVVVNAPLNLGDAAYHLDRGLSRLYGLHFTKELSAQHGLKQWPKSIRKFDEIFTAPRAGYNSAQEYYESCSAAGYVDRIKTPTVVLTAKDDPFISSHLFENLNWPESVHLRIEDAGGHLGYIQKTQSGQGRWLDEYLKFIVDTL